MRASSCWLVVALVLSSSLAATAHAAKIAVLPIQPGTGVDRTLASPLTDAVAASVARAVRGNGGEVVTEQQIRALVDSEAQRQMMGCSDASCAAQISDALGVDELVVSTTSRIGASWLVGLKRIDAHTGSAKQADRRLKHAKVDDVLDAIPALVDELFPANAQSVTATPATTATTPAPTSVPTTPTTTAALSAPPGVDNGNVASFSGSVPTSSAARDATIAPDVRARLVVATDDAGRLLAWDPQGRYDGPIFAGTSTQLSMQRLSGGGADGDATFEAIFWDPRQGAGARRSIAVDVKAGRAVVTCGDRNTTFRVLDRAARARILQRARLLDVWWQRRLVAIARDDDLQWYVVDNAHTPEDAQDLRLYVGRAGAFRSVPVVDAVQDASGLVIVGDGVRLKLGNADGEWAQGGVTKKLVVVDTYDIAPKVYGPFRVYGEPLGTPCDGP